MCIKNLKNINKHSILFGICKEISRGLLRVAKKKKNNIYDYFATESSHKSASYLLSYLLSFTIFARTCYICNNNISVLINVYIFIRI